MFGKEARCSGAIAVSFYAVANRVEERLEMEKQLLISNSYSHLLEKLITPYGIKLIHQYSLLFTINFACYNGIVFDAFLTSVRLPHKE